MGLEIYKTGQGKIARGAAYALGAGLVIFGGFRLFATINRPGAAWVDDLPLIGSLSIYNAIAIAVTLLGLLGLHLVLNRTSSVDMLIDTEQELKKVSWPSGKEVQNATFVVVLVTFTMAMMLFGFDALLRWIFRLIF
jgi:preprotein translocase SecE subunit